MENNILQNFLDQGMLDIGEDDAKFDALKKAATDQAKILEANKPKVISYTLVALDPNIPSDDPVLVEVEDAVKTYWQTLRNKYKSTPKQILRAVILEALRLASENNEAVATIIWLTGGSFLPYTDLGREREICTKFISEMGEVAERKAVEDWTASHEYSPTELPPLNIQLPEAKITKVSQDDLAQELAAATGPRNEQGQAGERANRYWPNNNPEQWSHHFASRAAEGIVKVVNQSYSKLVKNINETISQFDEPLKEHASAIDTFIKNSIVQVIQSASMQERRGALLWWKQTLYSPSWQCSYRSLNSCQAALLMAYDLHKQVTIHTPQSVEYLLRESVREVIGAEGSAEVTLIKFCENLSSDSGKLKFNQLLGSEDTVLGRIPLFKFIQCTLQNQLNIDQLSERVGVASDTKVKLEELSTWLFRDFQAQRLAMQQDGQSSKTENEADDEK